MVAILLLLFMLSHLSPILKDAPSTGIGIKRQQKKAPKKHRKKTQVDAGEALSEVLGNTDHGLKQAAIKHCQGANVLPTSIDIINLPVSKSGWQGTAIPSIMESRILCQEGAD
jgi:hypothetical protein